MLFCAAPASFATLITFSGNFSTDDDLVTFQYDVQADGLVSIYTTSFASGGFEPIITVFDPSGFLVNFDVGSAAPFNDCGFHGIDPVTGACWDALVTWNSEVIGLYTVVLTQWGNESEDFFTLAAGFRETNDIVNSPNYTGEPPHNPSGSGSFLLPGPIQRTSDWTIFFEAEDQAGLNVVPEPASGLLLLGGAALVAWKKTRKKP
jgi:hypothetical protein